jgi:opacity protein-like surface antigen
MDSLPAFGQENPNYVAVKAGIYSPTGDLDDLDTGFAGEVVFGHYYSPTFALEGGIGRFETDGSFTEIIPFFGTVTEKDEASATTISLTLKGVHPTEIGELYIGGGIGIGFVDIDIDIITTSMGTASISDSDTVFGFQLLAGANFNITDKCFFGVEGKYLITDDAKVSGTLFGIPVETEGNANGFIITGVLGFRF